MTLPRVLMFSETFHPRVGGAERQAAKLARELIRQGCRVEMLTPQHEPEWPLREEVEGVPVNRFRCLNLTKGLPRLRGLGVPNTLFMDVQTRRAVTRLIGGFDILHAHIAAPLVASAMAAAQAAGRPVICKVASGGDTSDLRMLSRTSLLGPSLAQRLVSRMDRWVAISGEIRSDLEAAGVDSERIVSIPNGVELPLTPAPAGREVRRFLYLGRLSRQCPRDFATLMTAFEQLLGDVPECELRLVGGGEREGELRDLLQTLPRAQARTGIVGFSEPGSWLSWADVLVQPSTTEGMSNTLLEAMGFGVACIANDIPPNREVLDDGAAGLLVPVGDRGALASAMARLAASPEERTRLGRLGRERVEQVYALERVAASYLRLYDHLLSASPRRRPEVGA
jgi:glycosyltransferase involved in cell wall biosynthesis